MSAVIGKFLRFALLGVAILATAACSRGMEDLEEYIAEVRARPGTRIEPLPVIQPYESFAYDAYELRSPFVPDTPLGRPSEGSGNNLRPDSQRTREYLEQFPLDTLQMVGTLTHEGSYYGLLQAADSLIHRVQVGNYAGQNDGRIVEIDESEIRIIEIIPDGIGGYMERMASIGLGEE
mgnify:CR=1 FL=1